MSRSKQPLTIEHAILGLLREQPIHGYEVHQRLSAPEALGPIWPIKQGQFYALVRRLEAEGLLSVSVEQRGALPPRKLLQLTAAGAEAFGAWLAAEGEAGDEGQRGFLARLYFARLQGPAAVRQLLLRQRRQSLALLERLRAELEAAQPQSYPWLVAQWQARQAEGVLDWLARFGLAPAPGIAYPIAALADSPAAALARAFVAFACGPTGQALLAGFGFLPAAEPPRAPAEPPHGGSLTIFAAASLAAAFEALGAAFTAAHPAASLSFTFGGSHALANDLAAGARADVFAPAHHAAMEVAVAAGRVAPGAAQTLAYNQLAIVTPAEGRAPLSRLADLARPGLRLALGSEATAIGHYTQDMLAAAALAGSLDDAGSAAILRNVVSYGDTVTGVLAKVVAGEVDAGIVFTSDAYRAAGAVQVAVVPQP